MMSEADYRSDLEDPISAGYPGDLRLYFARRRLRAFSVWFLYPPTTPHGSFERQDVVITIIQRIQLLNYNFPAR